MTKKKVVAAAVSILVVLFAILFFSGDQGIATYFQTSRKIRELTTEITQTQHTIDSLTLEIKRLKNDTSYIEKIAREKYGMARSDETMYKFIEEK